MPTCLASQRHSLVSVASWPATSELVSAVNEVQAVHARSPAGRCCAGPTLSEGGFAPNKTAAASVLDVQEATDKKGKKYYKVGSLHDVVQPGLTGPMGTRMPQRLVLVPLPLC